MKRKLIIIIVFFITIATIFTIAVNIYIPIHTRNRIISIDSINLNDRYDAILVLGCKAYINRPSLMLSKRLDKAYEVYKQNPIKLLLTGDHGKEDYDEVNVMKDYLLTFNVSNQDIFLDHAGFSTYDSLYRAKNVFGAKKIIIVTQKYHMYRALYLAEKIGIDAVGVIADDIPQKGIMLKNEIREILSRDKSFVMGIIKPKSKYTGDYISLNQDGEITKG